MTQPPRIATLLLKRMLSNPARESLIGDLVERHRGGRSSFWYWRQALVAICVDFFSEVRDHKLLVIRAIAIGIAVLWLLGRITAPLSTWIFVSIWNWTVENNLDSVRGLLFQQGGWLLSVPAALLIWPAGGWVIARTHRPHGMAMVFAFVMFHHLIYLSQSVWFYGLFAASSGPRLSTLLISQGSWLVTTAVYLILGGLLDSGSQADAPRGQSTSPAAF